MAYVQHLNIQPWHHIICKAITCYEYLNVPVTKMLIELLNHRKYLIMLYFMLSATRLPCVIQQAVTERMEIFTCDILKHLKHNVICSICLICLCIDIFHLSWPCIAETIFMRNFILTTELHGYIVWSSILTVIPYYF